MKIQAGESLNYADLNEIIRSSVDQEVQIEGCVGQRYIGAGLAGRKIRIKGTPGNALGAYLDGSEIFVDGNAQDAIGDTMNAGKIVVKGNAGDAVGYAMRGGKIFIRGDAGYRVGIHMKAYKEHRPVIVVGGIVGSFLGEYQAGGIIVVLDLEKNPLGIVGNFCGTGMHGGEMYLRCDRLPTLPAQVRAERVERVTEGEIFTVLKEYCDTFSLDLERVLSEGFYRLTPNTDNPYRQMYTAN
ncbi:MAG: glutamate synthase [Candidatus Gallimonas sp.]